MDGSRWESRHRSETSILDWVLWLSGNRSANQDLKRRFCGGRKWLDLSRGGKNAEACSLHLGRSDDDSLRLHAGAGPDNGHDTGPDQRRGRQPPLGVPFLSSLEIAPMALTSKVDQQPRRARQSTGLFRFTQTFKLFLGCAEIPTDKAQRSDNTYDSENPVQ